MGRDMLQDGKGLELRVKEGPRRLPGSRSPPPSRASSEFSPKKRSRQHRRRNGLLTVGWPGKRAFCCMACNKLKD